MGAIEKAEAHGYDSKTKIWHSTRPEIKIPEDEMVDVVEWLHQRTPDREVGDHLALVDVTTEEQLTYREFKLKVQTVAAGLSNLGINHGDVVLLLAPNSVWFPVICFGVMSLGGIITTVNPVCTTQEILKQVKDSGAIIAITTDSLYSKVEPIGLPTIILGAKENCLPKKTISFSTVLAADPDTAPRVRRKQSDTAAVLYSSGTTGLSKGVVISHRNFIAVAMQLHLDAPHVERDRRYVCTLPMFHVYGLALVVLGQLTRGGRTSLIILPKFEVELFLRSLEKYRATDVALVPPMVLLLAQSEIATKYDLSSVVEVSSGAAPLGKDLMGSLQKRFPTWEIRQGFGMTETSGLLSVTLCYPDRSHYGSAGELVSSMEARVVDVTTGENVPPYGEGEICVRGPTIMQGYLNNPTATAATIDSGGWLHTGDLGYFDELGRVWIVDRLKELIKYKGYQVAPAELEALLLTHPQIMDAAVVPQPDVQAGEVPIAYVVRAPNSNLTEKQIQSWVARQVSPYKRLRKVTFIAAIPKSASGKILRKDLVQLGKSKL
ncbi:unnamed protein product [Calypogeia fissa]